MKFKIKSKLELEVDIEIESNYIDTNILKLELIRGDVLCMITGYLQQYKTKDKINEMFVTMKNPIKLIKVGTIETKIII